MAENRNNQEQNINNILKERLLILNQEMAMIGDIGANVRGRLLAEEKLLTLKKQERIVNEDITDENKEQLNTIKNQIDSSERLISKKKQLLKIYQQISQINEKTFNYLMSNDKIIRQTTLNLGLSGGKAQILRDSFMESVGYATRLGGSMADLQLITQSFADETGRARVLSSETLENILLIGKGTALGVEGASKLTAQFELLGVNSARSLEYVQGVVETSERMGVNSNKVLKNVSDNFKKLQTFSFNQGVKGFANMAMYAEKMRIDMSQALNAAEHARSLDKAIELAAQLQVMGGEFAKTDPFQLLFLSRNDPEAFTKKINDMTKGVVTFRRMSDGTFEKFISPADRDRLAVVEKSLGMQTGELTEQALRMADIQKMRQHMLGMGLTTREKEVVEGMATFDSKLGRMVVKIGSTTHEISSINSQFLRSLESQKSSLEDRALAAMTFDDAFKATVEELKTALLPMLKGINVVLEKIRPIAISVTEFITKLSKNEWASSTLGVVGGISAMLLLTSKVVVPIWKGISSSLVTMKGLVSKTSTMKNLGGGVSQLPPSGSLEQGKMQALAGKGAMMKGVGVGAAGLGIGAGIGVAALGISELAKSMKDLDVEQLRSMEKILLGIGIAIPVFTAGIIGVSMAAKFNAVGIGVLTLAVLGIGTAIGIASAGIGYMAKNLGDMAEKSIGAGPAMLQLASGVTLMTASLVGMGAMVVPATIGAMRLSKTLETIGKHAPAISLVGNAFKELNAVLNASEEDFMKIESLISSIKSMNVNSGTVFSELANMLKTPLKVEWADKNVSLVSNITLEMEGTKIAQKMYKQIAPLQMAAVQGKNN